MTEPAWWRDAVVYQVYVRSFADSDGDGVGDLPGIRSRLPYLRDLGVDGIWLTPFYPSPGADHGYDVANYVDVDPQLGTLADFDELLADAHALGLRVLVDIVPNHTSNEHPWFVNALSSRDHPDRARYVFRPGLDGGPPNGWTSVFGGPAWTCDEPSGEYYLHLFAPEQPDLDWHVDAVPEAFEEILRFWLDRGVDGFRIDVAQALFKAQDLHEVVEPENPTPFADWHTALQQQELHGLYRRWRELAGGYDRDRAFVAEISLEDEDELARFVRPDELNLVFNFAFLHAPWEADALRGVVDRACAAFGTVGAPPAWVLENHDVTRLPTRRGDRPDGLRRARASLLLMLALPGASFVYQGQELGLEEAVLRDDERQDPIFARTNGERLGRDGCRVPLPWTDEGRGLGFTTGVPWLPMPEEWAWQSVERQRGDATSTLELTRSALALRREHLPPGATTGFAWRESPPGTLVFERTTGEGTLVCVVNVAGEPYPLDGAELLLTSTPLAGARLPADAAAWLFEARVRV